MANKLMYKEYNNCNDIITIDLHNGYTLIAIKSWNKDEHNYSVDFYIKENTIDKWDLVDDAKSTVFNTNFKIINSAILRWTQESLNNGLLKYYIDRYEYELNCFAIGDGIMENNIEEE